MKKHQPEQRNRQQTKPIAVRDLASKDARNVIGGWSVPEYGGSPATVTKAGRTSGDDLEYTFYDLLISSSKVPH